VDRSAGGHGLRDEDLTVALHGILDRSRANGPGVRTVIWFQGCTLGCRGCFNPQTHDPNAGRRRPLRDLVADIVARQASIAGVTVSGGEPFQQPLALYRLVRGIRERTALSILVFSGYRPAEIRALAEGPSILGLIDVLIAGRYLPSRHLGKGLLGSANQEIHFLTDRHTIAEIVDTPTAEIHIDVQGRVTITGVAPPPPPAY
jgi:anaerobic ribonucleoside-triphosphate reductase activating protein